MRTISPTSATLPELLLAMRRKISENARVPKFKNDITMSQAEVLWYLGTSGPSSMDTLATFLKIKPPSVTPMVNKLESIGLVERRKREGDRRVIEIALTKSAEKELSALKKEKEAAFDKLLQRVSKTDRLELERILLIIVNNK
jgi:DNA-binding MarR family transcriptional regulator